MQEARVLIVDDDDAIAGIVATYLRREGLQTGRAADGPGALAMAGSGGWSLILLDVMLPGLDGFEICRMLRAGGVDVPILFLTARSEEVDQVLGLGLGADDYIMKPFSGAALAARVKAHLRRYRELKQHGTPPAEEVLRFPGLEIDTAACEVRRDGRVIPLTPKEYELLCYLARNKGRVLTRDQLFANVWGEEYLGSDDNTVAVHIRRLREKLEADPSEPRYVTTVRGIGYRFNQGA